MNLKMVVTAVLVGLIAGWLAGKVMKAGGYGLKWDTSLGLIGSIAGSWIFRGSGVSRKRDGSRRSSSRSSRRPS